MDSQLRTRLIGAAVMIGLAVIFLPMLLDKGDAPAPVGTEEIPLDIPEPGSEGMQTRTLPLNQDAPLVEVDATAPDPIAHVDTARAAAPVSRLVSETESAPDAPETGGTIQRPSPSETKPEALATKPPVASETTAAAPRSPTPQSSATKAPATSTNGRFAVNFGSYGALANAEKLITQLAAVNIKASAEAINVSGKSLFRVVAKGYGTRANAEAARLAATTSINGLNASVLQGDLSSDGAPASVVAPALQSFAVQIGVYGDKAKADQLIAQLKAKGFAAFAERVITPSGSTIRVRVGPILKRVDADKSKAEIKAKLGLDSIIVPFP
jgi:DedD protein